MSNVLSHRASRTERRRCQARRAPSVRLSLEYLEERLVLAASVPDQTALVQSFYGGVLGRTPAGTETDYWVGQLQSGVSPQTVASAFYNSPEQRGLQVDGYYLRFFNRAADAAGHNSWVANLLSGMSEFDVQEKFLSSGEYASLHPSNAAFVDALYADVLNRAADAAGEAGWIAALQASSTRAEAARAFLTSSENVANILDVLYLDYLGRPADASATATYSAGLQAGTLPLSQVVTAILSSPEYVLRSGNYQWVQQDYVEPPVLQSQNGILKATLDMAQGPALIAGQQVLNAETYNGLYPGPTLKVNPGDVLNVTIKNDLSTPTNLHTHGLHVSPIGNGDNVFLEIDPGQSFEFHIPLPPDHPEGLYWYHPHHHGVLDQQLFSGLAGLIVVGNVDGGFPEFSGLAQRVMSLKNTEIGSDGMLTAPPPPGIQTQQLFTINGQLNPTLTMAPGESQVWSIANTGNDSFYDIRLDAHKLYVIGEDGEPLQHVRAVDSLVMPPGKRYTFIVQGDTTGTYHFRTAGFNNGDVFIFPPATLATLVVQGRPDEPKLLPDQLSSVNNYFRDLRNVPVAANRQLVFAEDLMNPNNLMFTVNGQIFPNVPVIQPELNTVEEWILLNDTQEFHPFHIHVNNFEVISINGQPYTPDNLQDIVNIPPKTNGVDGSVVIRMEFKDYVGAYVYHCHISFHEDMGMMGVVNVIQPVAMQGNAPPGVMLDQTEMHQH
jgi:suppressor of ftsI